MGDFRGIHATYEKHFERYPIISRTNPEIAIISTKVRRETMLESRKKRFYSRLKQQQQKTGGVGDPLDQYASTVRYGQGCLQFVNHYENM